MGEQSGTIARNQASASGEGLSRRTPAGAAASGAGLSRRAFIGAASAALAASALTASFAQADNKPLIYDPPLNGTMPPRRDDSADSQAQAQGLAAHDGEGRAPQVEELLASMSRRQKIAQMLMPDFRMWRCDGESEESGLTELNSEVDAILDAYGFGGVILFAENVVATEQTLHLTAAMQQAAMRNSAGATAGGVPLLIGLDQEGGIVYRLATGTALPGNMAVGATQSADFAQQCGGIIGRELEALGINLAFAPVMDVNCNPNNPVIGLRSFSDRPEPVSQLGTSMIGGIRGAGTAACAKHFPGHGDAATDSHIGLPRVDKSLDELEAMEFVPFRAAIDANVDVIMTAHIQFPQVDATMATSIDASMGEIELPATLSSVFMTDILRTELGFAGVSITDALNMDAIATNFGTYDAVKRSILAGVDIALMPLSLRQASDAASLDDLLAGLEADADITDDRLNESAGRILDLKYKLGLLTSTNDAGVPDALAEDLDTRVSEALAQVGCDDNRAIEREVAACAVTVVKNDGYTLPFQPTSGQHVLLVAAYANEQPGMELGMRRLMDEGMMPADVTYESACYTAYGTDASQVDAAASEIEAQVAQASYVVVISEINSAASLQEAGTAASNASVPLRVVRAANAAGVPVCVMSIAKPYDAVLYGEAPAVACVFGNKGMDPTDKLKPSEAFGPNVPAGIEVIFGGHGASGVLPVDLFAVATDDSGTTYIDTSQVIYPYGTGEGYAMV